MEKIIQQEELIIRNMATEDIDGICKVENDFSEEFVVYLKRQIQFQMVGDSQALLAVYDGNMAGYVFVFKHLRWGSVGHMGLPGIADLKVFPTFRKNGIAGKLMDAAETWAAGYCDRVCLEVCLNSEYGAAQRFYVRRGYVPDGKGVYYQNKLASKDALCRNDDELCLCMIKELKSS